MTDEFLSELHADWMRQDAAVAAVHARLQRTRWRPHLTVAFELAGSAVALLCGAWFAWVAATTGSLIFALSAAVLFLAIPPFAIAGLLARRHSLRWDEETPESVLKVALRRADASLRSMRLGWWHLVVIGVFVAFLWVLEWLGVIHELEFLLFYTAFVVLTAAPYALWLRWRERWVIAQRAACERLLRDLEPGDDAPA